jgi:hypothetical protein
VENVLDQAKYFLDNSDEFYPFGSILTNDGEIRPLGAFTGDDFPGSEELINVLEKSIKEGVQNHRYIGGGIAIDVFLTSGIKERINGIEIRLYNEELLEKCYFRYEKKGGEYFLFEYAD